MFEPDLLNFYEGYFGHLNLFPWGVTRAARHAAAAAAARGGADYTVLLI